MSDIKIVLLQHETFALAKTQVESHFSVYGANSTGSLLNMTQTEQQNADKPQSKHT